MSIALEAKVRELETRVKALEDARPRAAIWAESPSEPTLADRAAAYKAKFGEFPHHRMKPETIEAKLRE